MAERGPLCVGIDPHPALLSHWGLTDDIAGLERFALTVVEALADRVAALKPQCAFFERHGSRGVAVLERVLAEADAAGALTIADAKRGDIGSTMQAYAEAFVGEASPLAADAVTASAYLGYESLRPLLDLAASTGRGVFVLALTSNPEGPQVQHARADDGRTVAQTILDAIAAENRIAFRNRMTAEDRVAPANRVGAGDRRAAGHGTSLEKAGRSSLGGPPAGPGDHHRLGVLGSVGAVVGATIGAGGATHDLDIGGPLLAPGIGAQGAGAPELRAVFGASLPAVLASSSREVLRGGPTVDGLRAAAARTMDDVASALA